MFKIGQKVKIKKNNSFKKASGTIERHFQHFTDKFKNETHVIDNIIQDSNRDILLELKGHRVRVYAGRFTGIGSIKLNTRKKY